MSLRPASEHPRERLPGISTGQLGMVILLISISVLFVAATLAVLITHSQALTWRTSESSGLHWTSAVSTALLVAVSAQLQLGLVAMRSNRFTRCLNLLRRSTYAAGAFLFVQAWNARQLLAIQADSQNRLLFLFSYGLLVGLHAAHVLGGFVPLLLVQARIARREYSSSRHAGLTFTVQYWHFLGVLWLGLLATLAWVA